MKMDASCRASETDFRENNVRTSGCYFLCPHAGLPQCLPTHLASYLPASPFLPSSPPTARRSHFPPSEFLAPLPHFLVVPPSPPRLSVRVCVRPRPPSIHLVSAAAAAHHSLSARKLERRSGRRTDAMRLIKRALHPQSVLSETMKA